MLPVNDDPLVEQRVVDHAGEGIDANDALDTAPHVVRVTDHPRPDIEDDGVGGQMAVQEASKLEDRVALG